MTEDEAKTKACFQATGFAASGGTRTEYGAESRNGLPVDCCIGSACMAWRWNEPWTSQTEEGVGGDLVIRLKRKPGDPKLGFCGLSGAPA